MLLVNFYRTIVVGLLLFEAKRVCGADPCSTATYNKTSQTCCSYNNYTYISTGRGLTCCRSSAYNATVYKCCLDGTVNFQCCNITNSSSTGFNPRINSCCPISISGNYAIVSGIGGSCCASTGYNISTQTCCNNVRLYIGSNLSCCGNVSYSSTISTCCGVTIVTGKNLSCCGSTGYSAPKICCNNITGDNNVACCGLIGYNPSTQSCNQNSNSNTSGSSGSVINGTKFVKMVEIFLSLFCIFRWWRICLWQGSIQ
jgi:hypothetical protein